MTYNEVLEKIKKKVADYAHFKIGKTEKELDVRFEEAYKGKYDKILKICHSSHSATITNWEKSLIKDFMNDSNYEGKCDNISTLDGFMANSKDFHIYVVVKN